MEKPKPEDYLHMLDGTELEHASQEAKMEYLETLFEVMKRFVDLSYELDPMPLARKEDGKQP